MTRKQAERAVLQQGGSIGSRVTDDTSFVVRGTGTGIKAVLGEMSDAQVIDEERFITILRDGVESVFPVSLVTPEVGSESIASEPRSAVPDALVGNTFVLTGRLVAMTREDAAREIRDRGGKVSSSVSSGTTFVVAGADSGSKLAKAHDLGVPVLTEDDFLILLREGAG